MTIPATNSRLQRVMSNAFIVWPLLHNFLSFPEGSKGNTTYEKVQTLNKLGRLIVAKVSEQRGKLKGI
jgi:hypothetical protein